MEGELLCLNSMGVAVNGRRRPRHQRWQPIGEDRNGPSAKQASAVAAMPRRPPSSLPLLGMGEREMGKTAWEQLRLKFLTFSCKEMLYVDQ